MPQFRDALLDGYTQIRPLPGDQRQYLDLCLAAYYIYLSLWAGAMAHLYPKYQEELSGRMERAKRLVERGIKIGLY